MLSSKETFGNPNSLFEEYLQAEGILDQMSKWASVIPASFAVEEYLEKENMQIVTNSGLPDDLVLACSRDFPIEPDPKPHDYSASFPNGKVDERAITHAINYVDAFNYKGHKLWLQVLPPNLFTSDHTHKKHEARRVLFGQVAEGNKIIRAGQGRIVPPDTYHRSTTFTQPAIMLCALVYGAEALTPKIHNF